MGYILLYVVLQFAFTAATIVTAYNRGVKYGVHYMCNRIVSNMMQEHSLSRDKAKSFLMAVSGTKERTNVRSS